ncbi:MAG: carbohydrate ABC transporter permease [Clostridiales bacterium]|jgi:multiple sugar transport system permease protein|nr:carbohydrate ABC transporter permease [Clostridiales bacterium]
MSYQGSKINPTKFDRSQIGFYVVLVPLAFLMVLPIVYIVSTAFKPFAELFAYPPRFLARRPTMENFEEVVQFMESTNVPVSRYFFNSLTSTFVVVAASVIMSLQSGYVLSKKSFKLKKTLFAINTISLMFVPAAVKIPRYLLIEKAGLLNTFAILALPLVAMPVGLFLTKQFIDQVPDALIEAARIDGAKDRTIITQVVAPIVKPALVTVAILAFQLSWNSYEASNLYINSDELKTFAFFMNSLSVNAGTEVVMQGMLAATTLVLFVPNLIIFICMQSQVLNTMAYSGIK